MELTFIAMHDSSPDCRILFVSDSIVDILGYQQEDVLQKSTFDYFHPDEVMTARREHKVCLERDQASTLAYVRLKDKQGHWVGCESVFSCVSDVLISATTIYRAGDRSECRALSAPIVRRAFRPSKADMRYEMLAHISSRFTSITSSQVKEKRAALILNRFTDNLTILYATDMLYDLVQIQPDQAVGRSFLSFLSSDCLEGAGEAFGRVKHNDSIAYMRFRWRRNDENQSRELNDEKTEEFDVDKDYDVDMESVVCCTSDGIVVIVRKSASDRIQLPENGIFVVPWSQQPLYSGSSELAVDGMIRSDDTSDDSQIGEKTIMTSIRDMGVPVWGLQTNPQVIREHAYGRPGNLATPDEEDFAEKVV